MPQAERREYRIDPQFVVCPKCQVVTEIVQLSRYGRCYCPVCGVEIDASSGENSEHR
jgi:hypothetical protein